MAANDTTAINQGVNLSNYFLFDKDGVARPATGPWDIGAYQYVGTTTNTNPPPPLIAAFTASATNGAKPLTIQFTDKSTGSPVTWSWNFSDGTTSSLQSPAHTYQSAGTYNPALTVSGSNGQTSAAEVTIVVTNPPITNGPTVASFSSSVTTGAAPLTVYFTNTSTGTPKPIRWYFGDNNTTSTNQTVTHVYAKAGEFVATLATGSSATSTRVIATNPPAIITNPPLDSVVVSFAATNGVLKGFSIASNYIFQPVSVTNVSQGATAKYSFTLAGAGEFVVKAVVLAPDTSQNSFYFTIDSTAQDPENIWDVPVSTNGFQNVLVSQRINGTADADKLNPVIYNLFPGNHVINLVGREPNALLKSLSVIRITPGQTNFSNLLN